MGLFGFLGSSVGGGVVGGVIGGLTLGPAGAIAGASLGASLGGGGYQVVDTKNKTDEAKRKNDQAMAQQERVAKANTLKEFNRALATANSGGVAMERELVENKRKNAAKDRFYGSPTNVS